MAGYDPNARYLGQPSFLGEPTFLGFATAQEGGLWGAYLTLNGYVIGVVRPLWASPAEAADHAFCSLQRLEARHAR